MHSGYNTILDGRFTDNFYSILKIILHMSDFKVSSMRNNKTFVGTKAYKKILNEFQDLKECDSKIVHVLGAPGTDKSTNIYKAIGEANLKVLNC